MKTSNMSTPMCILLTIVCSAIQVLPTASIAEQPSRLGFTLQDVTQFKSIAVTIGSCKAALAMDPLDFHNVDTQKAPTLARLYGQCHKALEARHARLGVLRVNDSLLGIQCMVVGASGGDAHAIAACDYPSNLPDPSKQH
jgi:hypothetical protein